ncbi:MAG: hypothetical protein JW891_14220 [Candidatus Lokiarchaeota archaeon]|nr:hypothetical protein [Candidatus Lokiarchaeota archaeon]
MENTNSKKFESVILRNYPKVVFFYPLFVLSVVLWILELNTPEEIPWIGFVWMTVFFINLFTIAFDISSTKFFIFLLIVLVLVLILIFAILPYIVLPDFSTIELHIRMTAEFYLAIVIILIIVFITALISARFDYWKIERNEAYHKRGIFATAERYPSKGLRILKKLPDIFELALLGAGSITLNFGDNQIFHLDTILMVNKKSRRLDNLLSELEIDIT